MGLLKYKLSDGWKTLYGGALANILRKDKNLSDLNDRTIARENLELTGNNNTTHYHDSRYMDKITVAQNTANQAALDITTMRRELETAIDTLRNDVEQNYAYKNAANIDKNYWSCELAKGIIEANNQLAVSGETVHTALDNTESRLFDAVNATNHSVAALSEAIAHNNAIADAVPGGNGYVRFSNGIVIQWGNGVEPNGNNARWSVGFPLSLTAVYSVVTNDSYDGDASYLATSVTSLIRNSNGRYSGFTVRTASYGNNRYYWIAVGQV